METRNLAARAGRWSAHHRRKAIWGWIAFVVIAFAIGSAAGTKNIKDEDAGNGDARTAARAEAHAGLKDLATERVLIQSRGNLHADQPQFRAAILDVQQRVAGKRYVVN